MFVFLVIQGSKPKNKETVSFRILLNHIQILALLSGNKQFDCFHRFDSKYNFLAAGVSWSDPFQTLLVVGSFISFVDSRIVATDCAAPVSYYYKYAFYTFFPLLSVLILLIVYGIFLLVVKILKKG